MRFRTVLAALVCAALFSACAMPTTARTQTRHVRSDGTSSVGVRSAADGLPGETGPQELVGVYLPFGPFAVKGALLWDGTTFNPTIPIPMAAPSAATYADPCTTPQFVDVQEVYDEPETRMVRKTRTVRRAVVPIPQAAPNPCAPPTPAPQAAPRPCPSPPVACDPLDPSSPCYVASTPK